jgi:peptidoglycan hydrolase-like protein with peptidoglycan-binding domain
VDIDLPVLRIGMQGPAVARLQDRLTALGFYSGMIDGIFGPETLAAVQLAQRNYELDPDGVVGPATWTVLLQP